MRQDTLKSDTGINLSEENNVLMVPAPAKTGQASSEGLSGSQRGRVLGSEA